MMDLMVKRVSINFWIMKHKWLIGCIILLLSACGNKISYDEKGWEFVLDRLKSPSSAKLISCVDKDGMKVILDNLDVKLNLSITAEMYDFDAQNSFGSMIRESYVVFFKNGEPFHLEKSSTVKSVPPYILKSALRINGGGTVD